MPIEPSILQQMATELARLMLNIQKTSDGSYLISVFSAECAKFFENAPDRETAMKLLKDAYNKERKIRAARDLEASQEEKDRQKQIEEQRQRLVRENFPIRRC